MEATDPRERRKQLRICRRRDLVVVEERYEGRTHHVVKDPVGLTYYRLKGPEHFLFERLDGVHTLEDARQEFERHYRPRRISLEEVEGFARQLVRAGLAHSVSPRSGQQLYDHWQRRRMSGTFERLSNVLALRLPLCNPDRFLRRLVPWFGWLFSPPGAIALGFLVLAALTLVATHFDAFRARLPAARDYFGPATVLQLWIAIGLVKVCHEFGHGISCKKFGGDVPEMGLLVLCFVPCLFCNVSDAWTLPGKWRRMIIGLGGVYVELGIAALATFVWWTSTPNAFLHHLSLNLIVVCGVSTVLINSNPLLRYDGYYVLADWLEIANLNEQAHRHLRRLAGEVLLGMPARGPSVPLRRAALLAGYAVASTVYRWAMTFAVLGLMAVFLKPYRLQGVVAMLTSIFIALGLYRFGRSLHRQGRLPPIRVARVAATCSVLLGLVLAFAFVRIPVAGVRQRALIEVRPEAVTPVLVKTTGVLHRVHVREGQRVQAGDLLAEFQSLDLDTQQADTQFLAEMLQTQQQALRDAADRAKDDEERGRTDASRARLAAESSRLAQQADMLTQMRGRLQLRAPRAGVVMGLPPVDQLGKTWEPGPQTPFCRVGEPDQLWALVPLAPAEYRLLRQEMHAQTPLKAHVRLGGRADNGWEATVVQLPEAEAQEIPLALTQKAGGPVAARPGSSPLMAVPQQPQYVVAVAFRAPVGVAPGCLGQVALCGRGHSAAWWVWRGFCQAFDLSLL